MNPSARRRIQKAVGLDRPAKTLSIVAGALILGVLFPRYVVATGSMEPTMPLGSYVVACRLLPGLDGIKKGDLLVFRPVAGVSPHPWIHRALALPGDAVSPPSRKGRMDVSSTGVLLSEPKVLGEHHPLAAGEYYESGDSENSYHGVIDRQNVIAKVLFHFRLPWR
jgi:signal peptidase I